MRHFKLTIIGLACILFGCQQAELIDPNENGGQEMKTVTISAGRDLTDTKASLDSETGVFSWQSGDVLSVLATDGKFYDFVLESGDNSPKAEFKGSIPAEHNVTTVATYPNIVDNASDNTILTGNTLNYVLASEIEYRKDVSNVPMIAAFGEGAEDMTFWQIGGVMRFPVKNLPAEARFVVTMHDKTICGPFSVDITNLGKASITAGNKPSVVTISYSSDVDGASAEFNVPVPVGTYNNFNVSILDADGETLLSKDYTAKNNVYRSTLLNMSEIVLPERPVVIAEVWPFFVDARVTFGKYEGVTDYAFYIDGADEPVILTGDKIEALENEMNGALIGGTFEHNTEHTVAVAKVVNGVPVPESKSEAVTFKTGRVMQMTYNTGTKFICAGWDDVAIGTENSTVYDEATKKWSLVPKDANVSDRNMRGYHVQLYDEDMTLLYDEVPFSSQVDYGGAFANSSWIGKTGGSEDNSVNYLLPTSLSFGWLDPDKKYYFRVQTLAEPVVFDSPETDCFEPSTAGYTLKSTRGGCGWSNLVEMKTDPVHIGSATEVFYEGFDDMMFNNDIMNAAPAVVPQFLTEATPVGKAENGTSGTYHSRTSGELYKSWLQSPHNERKFSEQGFNAMLGVYYHGLSDDTFKEDQPRYLNEYAGSLQGWSVQGKGGHHRTIYPGFGSIRLGQSGGSAGKVDIRTPPIHSSKLSDTEVTKCRITVKVSAHATDNTNVNRVLGIYLYRDGGQVYSSTTNFSLDGNEELPEWRENYKWTNKYEYTHYPRWFEVKKELYLRNGDIISITKANPDVNGKENYYKGCITIGEILVEVLPDTTPFTDNGVGTEPDNTDYNKYKMTKFPISYFWGIPTSAYMNADGTYDSDKRKAYYQEIKDAGFTIANYGAMNAGWGMLDPSYNENKAVLELCKELGMKFLGHVGTDENGAAFPSLEAKVAFIKEKFGSDQYYLGDHGADEPFPDTFDTHAQYINLFKAAMPDKDLWYNLFPNFVAENRLGMGYEEYVDLWFQKAAVDYISFDYYPIHNNGSIRGNWYVNLDMIRAKSLAVRKPYWVIVQGGDVDGTTAEPTETEHRWSVWSSIALGAKGIQYFCYWTPTHDPGVLGPFMVKADGTQTDMYKYTKTLNKDIQTIGMKLLPCHADGAIRTGWWPLYVNKSKGRSTYGPVQNIDGTERILVGCFRDARTIENGDNYKGYKVLVTHTDRNLNITKLPEFTANLSLQSSIEKVTLTFKNTETVFDLATGNTTLADDEQTVTATYANGTLSLTMPEGGAVLVEF